MTFRHDGLLVDWLGYATVRLEAQDGTVVYFDPGRYGVLDDYNARDGDVVCVTHNHHYDSDGIERVAKEDATVVIFENVNHRFIDRDVLDVNRLPYEVRKVDDEVDIAVGDVIIRSFAAYNEPDGPHTKSSGEPFHKEGTGVGYLVTLNGVNVFWPGDTDVLEGHEQLDVSLFMPPIGGSYTMDRHEAADLAEAMDPDLVCPIHYNTFEALEADGQAFAADVASRSVPVVLDER
ncbi:MULTISPECIES: MBL fold metallo-hydrolase [unclassified Haladaptatus]|uniref:MBL fold metallo-hydrolase n=1 Tax=unclassified Haladaptatus TaxID=2622732 RepID=UPI0023E8EA14|nr:MULTISPECIES: MBL fold metallo-hydrolase [unclassified Haladaptatus]